jgi:FkbM family methyltransferase
MPSVYESVRESLLKLGPANPVLRSAIRLQARASGFRVDASAQQIALSKDHRRMLLPVSHYPVVPSVVHMWDLLFDTVAPQMQGEDAVLDFSKPGLHRYNKSGVALWSPGVVEEDSMDAYVAGYHPQPGDVVWDIGAHAGATSYFFAQMVGSGGKVYAFEPDELSHSYLLRNIELHQLQNVIPVKKALAESTGTARFSMDGTLGAGLADFTQCPDKSKFREVETISFTDACHEYEPPTFVKMDVEGAEVAVIHGALSVLKETPIRFAIETEHRVNREYTSVPITGMLSGIGYKVWSSREFGGQQFTWAEPKAP